MLKRYCVIVLTILLFNLVCLSPIYGQKTLTVEQVKEKIAKRGMGEKARVIVKLKDGTKIKGYINQTNADDFVVIDSKTKQSTTVAYSDVVEIKSDGLSKVAKITIGIIVAAVVIITIGLVKTRKCYDGIIFRCGPSF